jgi:hypothetical protein
VSLLAVSTPARVENARQFVSVLRILSARYPNARRVCVFHRGVLSLKHTTRKKVAADAFIATAASMLGYEIVNAAGNLTRIGTLDIECTHTLPASAIDARQSSSAKTAEVWARP